MNPNREELLFQLALLKPIAERAEFLDRECGDDAALQARIGALLAAHDEPDELLPKGGPAVAGTMKLDLQDAPDEAVGQMLGPYKLLERLGEGGCGVVYVAEQTRPVRRRVALKVIKLGMDTKQVVARFEAERQALAMMDHPNIAKVLDAGTTETGLRLGNGSTCSSKYVTPSSTRTRKASSIAISSRPTSSSRCTTACRYPRSLISESQKLLKAALPTRRSIPNYISSSAHRPT
jgi:hypothetical protein